MNVDLDRLRRIIRAIVLGDTHTLDFEDWQFLDEFIGSGS